MLCHKYMGVLAMMAAITAYSADAGVCYSPWHHSSVTDSVLQADFSQIKEYFTSIRTYHARFSGLNVVDEAAKAGLKVAVGIHMSDASAIESEITAACTGAVANPLAVEAIFVGNENMVNGDFGTFTAAQLVEYIQRIKTCTSGTGIKVGSVQRINEWSGASDAATLAAACDIIGVNIYPFFTEGPTTPMEKLDAQWSQITAKYSGKNVQLTETGWPRQGSSYAGNVPSLENAQSYFNDYITWSRSHATSYYFMMYDATISYSGADFEKFFGLADSTGKLQITMSASTATTSTATSTTAVEVTSPAITETTTGTSTEGNTTIGSTTGTTTDTTTTDTSKDATIDATTTSTMTITGPSTEATTSTTTSTITDATTGSITGATTGVTTESYTSTTGKVKKCDA